MRSDRTMKRALLTSAILGSALAALLVPGIAAAAGPIPASTACTAVGTAVNCDLWAKTGTLTPPGGSALTIWGYSATSDGPVLVPGPVLIVNEGDAVNLTLHNTLSRPTSILFGGQAMVSDITGAPAGGGTKSYSFTADNPGTYIYEAGLIPGSQYQAAMGLYGALVVRPTGDPIAPAGVTITRTDAAADVALGSTTVADAAVLATDLGSVVGGTGIPVGATIAAVTAGISFELSAPATAAGTGVTITRTDAAAQASYGSTTVIDAGVLATDAGSVVAGAEIPSGTTITGVTAGVSFTMSASTPLTAFGGASTVFDDEAFVVLGEIDPALNGSATPWTYDLRGFAPKWFLVNGAPFSSAATPQITTVGGHSVLLRYLNAGIQHHSIGALGLRQQVLAADGSELPYPRTMVAETLAPGQTADVLVDIPVSAATSTKYAIYDAAMLLNNSNVNVGGAYGIGGMLALISAAGTPAGTDTTGPITSGVTLTPAGTDTYTLTAIVDETSTGSADIAQAEYRVDSTANPPTPLSAADLAFDEVTESVTTFPDVIDTSTWSTGTHPVYVRGRDSLGNWGAYASTTVTLDKAGPTVSDLTLSPGSPSGVALAGTASDAATGNSNVVDAEYFVDTTGTDGTGAAVAVNHQAPIASITATIPDGTTGIVYVHALDSAGNWGPFETISLASDSTGPATTDVSASPNPNNGTLGVNSSTPAVRVAATFDDTASGGSAIAAAEGFIDTLGADGTGFVFVASDGVFNEVAEVGYADVPLTTINLLSVGNHTIHVHGRDAAGNWGGANTTVLTIEKTPPTITSIVRTDPNPTAAPSVSFLVTFSEDVVGVTSGNFTVVGGGGLTGASISSVSGSGATRTVTATNWSNGGTLGLNLTSATGIRDIAGNILPTAGLPFVGEVYTIVTPLYFSTSGNTNPPTVGGTADDADIYLWDGAAFSRVIDVTATLTLPGGANVDGFDRISASEFYASFNGTVNVPGLGNVADEDVVHYSSGAWSLYFDGSVNGLAATDLDAISIVGGTLYFSTDDTDVPPGAGGTGDDADIYSWDGVAYARVHDASALGWSTSNVDGFVRVDATHFYLSYSADTTVPGFGTVQDEDVVRHSAGTWSVYFDGTAKGLTAGNLDVDAFDLP